MPLSDDFSKSIQALTTRFFQEELDLLQDLNKPVGRVAGTDAFRHSAEDIVLLNLKERVEARMALELKYFKKHKKHS